MRELLKQHFGFDEFLPLQEEIIATVLEERDALVLIPVGETDNSMETGKVILNPFAGRGAASGSLGR